MSRRGRGGRSVGKLNETVPRRTVPRRALLSGSFGVSVGIEERRRACPFTDGQRDAEKEETRERERERESSGVSGASKTRARSITNTAHGISESDSAAHATASGQVSNAVWRCRLRGLYTDDRARERGASSTRSRRRGVGRADGRYCRGRRYRWGGRREGGCATCGGG